VAFSRAEKRLRIVMLFSLAWIVFIVNVPDFVMGILKIKAPDVHVACDISAVVVMVIALLYMLFQIKQERRVTHLLVLGVGLLVISQGLRSARILQWFDFLQEIKSYDWYHLLHVIDEACNGLGLVFIAAAFFTAIVDLFETKHRLLAQQEKLSEEVLRRAQIETAILQEKQKYKELVNNLPVAVYRNTPGPTGHFLEMNPAHVAMFEADSEDELLKLSVSDLYRKASKRREIADKLLRQGFIKNEEVELVTLKGRPIWGSVTAVVKHDQQGQPYFDGIIEDITARVQAEKLLAEQRAKMIESARLASLGIMAGGIAHEINNPLAVISGCAEQLEIGATTPQMNDAVANKLLRMIRSNTDRIQKTILGLRALSRDASGDPFVNSSLSILIENTVALCQERFRLSSIRLELDMPSQPLSFECRPSQVGQVLLNLLNNSFDAVKDLPEKWIKLSTALRGDWVEIAVEDSGSGIPKEIAGQLFVPFFTTKSERHGLGLGLSISHAIIEAHHGEIAVDASGSHTRFVVRLPIRQPSSVETG